MANDWSDKIVKKIGSNDAWDKAYEESRRQIQTELPKLFQDLWRQLHEKANVIHKQIGRPYFQISDVELDVEFDPPRPSIRVESPRGKISICPVAFLVVTIFQKGVGKADPENKYHPEKAYRLEMRDNALWFRIEDEYFTAGDVAEFVLGLLA